jgi:acetylornithine deacetylase/succinyl-diaminopimelate desuccinylase-like protein
MNTRVSQAAFADLDSNGEPPDPLDQWVSPPFELPIRNGRLCARGAPDNKGQHFAQVLGLESWLAVQGEFPCKVKVVLEGEGRGGRDWRPIMARTSRILNLAMIVS